MILDLLAYWVGYFLPGIIGLYLVKQKNVFAKTFGGLLIIVQVLGIIGTLLK